MIKLIAIVLLGAVGGVWLIPRPGRWRFKDTDGHPKFFTSQERR